MDKRYYAGLLIVVSLGAILWMFMGSPYMDTLLDKPPDYSDSSRVSADEDGCYIDVWRPNWESPDMTWYINDDETGRFRTVEFYAKDGCFIYEDENGKVKWQMERIEIDDEAVIEE